MEFSTHFLRLSMYFPWSFLWNIRGNSVSLPLFVLLLPSYVVIEGFIEIFEAKDMEWLWIDFFAVVEIPNSDWHQIETIVPSFIEHYRGIF